MNIKITSSQAIPPKTAVRLRCPQCRQRGTFDIVGTQDLTLKNENVIVGLRRCPDPECYGLIYFVFKQGKLADSYPVETIDFDATNIPTGILRTFEEAIKCHAQSCFVASAIMVRKTLEELCKDRNAAGA